MTAFCSYNYETWNRKQGTCWLFLSVTTNESGSETRIFLGNYANTMADDGAGVANYLCTKRLFISQVTSFTSYTTYEDINDDKEDDLHTITVCPTLPIYVQLMTKQSITQRVTLVTRACMWKRYLTRFYSRRWYSEPVVKEITDNSCVLMH